jgi:hypothetical protein
MALPEREDFVVGHELTTLRLLQTLANGSTRFVVQFDSGDTCVGHGQQLQSQGI